MTPLPQVIASNGQISNSFPDGLVAVFVGGTSGVGEYTLKALAKYTPKLRAYLVGRSQASADTIIQECLRVCPGGSFEFIQADISLLKSVDEVCRQIWAKEKTINLLFQSQGSMAFMKRTSEDLPVSFALATHSRMRFITGLLPLVQNATGLRRVVSVLAGTFEGPIDLDNLSCLGFPLLKQRDQVAAIHTLLLEEMKRRAPSVSFVHTVPGVVKSGITRDATGFGMSVIIAISNLMSPLISTSPDESGERHVFAATSAIYSPDHQPDHRQGVRSGTGVEVARGSNGQDGSGIYTVTHKGESSTAKEHLLDQFRKDGTAQKVWNMVDQDVQRITGSRMGA